MPALQDCPFSAFRPALSGACPPFILRPLQSQGQCQSTNRAESFAEHERIERERGFREPRASTGQGSHVGVGKEVHEEEIQLLACTTRYAGAVHFLWGPRQRAILSWVIDPGSTKTSLAFTLSPDLQPLPLSGVTSPSSASS